MTGVALSSFIAVGIFACCFVTGWRPIVVPYTWRGERCQFTIAGGRAMLDDTPQLALRIQDYEAAYGAKFAAIHARRTAMQKRLAAGDAGDPDPEIELMKIRWELRG